MRRKPLFPPPKDQTTGDTKRNKGRQDFTVQTINGRVRLARRRWHSANEGTSTPIDAWLDTAESTISLGVREMACRLNGDGKKFDKAAANLARIAQVTVSGETLRVLVETEGRRVLQAQRSGQLALEWSAADCRVEPKGATFPTRIYAGSDGLMVPLVTDAEKVSRRTKIKENRRRRGKKAKPLPPRKRGADQHYKEFKIVAFCDETQEHRLVAGTRGDCEAAGRLTCRTCSRCTGRTIAPRATTSSWCAYGGLDWRRTLISISGHGQGSRWVAPANGCRSAWPAKSRRSMD